MFSGSILKFKNKTVLLSSWLIDFIYKDHRFVGILILIELTKLTD